MYLHSETIWPSTTDAMQWYDWSDLTILGAFPPACLCGQSLSGYNLNHHEAWSNQVQMGSKYYGALKQDRRWRYKYNWAVILRPSLDSPWGWSSGAWNTLTVWKNQHCDRLLSSWTWERSEVYSHHHYSTCPCVSENRRHTPVFLQHKSHQSLAMIASNFHEGVRQKTSMCSYICRLLHIKILHATYSGIKHISACK